MRIGIRDLASPLGRVAGVGAFSVPVALDEDSGGCCGGAVPCGCQAEPVDPETPRPDGLPTLELLARRVDFLDEEGTPRYGWTPVIRGLAMMTEVRKELNDSTGQTMVRRAATMGWEGTRSDVPAETAVAQDEDGNRWEITSLQAFPGRLEIQMERIADAP